jgi:D-glycero-alpha-D-manno-heptose-7-phosphate kinase
MIITQTPLRISFLGGGTDYPVHYRKHGGETLVTTIDRYILVSVHRLTQFVKHRVRVHYSQVESVTHIDEISHPSARECLRLLGIENGIEIHYVSDLPARTGLGSSSSATVGLLKALHAFRGEMVSREQLAAEAIHVEQEMIRERVGSQDQYACAFGGFLHLQFRQDGSASVTPLTLPLERIRALQDRLMLFYTGIQRHAHEILDEQIQRTSTGDNLTILLRMQELVTQGIEVLARGNDLSAFGELLHTAWMLKRQLSSKVTTAWIDQIYERARRAGAIGGKLLGAGGGGFLLLYVEPYNRECVSKALPELRETTFAFENLGSQVIFYRPESGTGHSHKQP